MGNGYGYNGQVNVEPLSAAETEKAVQDYLAYYKDGLSSEIISNPG